MTLEEAIREMRKNMNLEDLSAEIARMEKNRMNDKQTIAKCVRTAYESSTPEGRDIAWEIAEEYGYTVEELLKPEPPKWYENIPEQGVLCWLGKDTRLVKMVVGTEDDYCMLANGSNIPLKKVIPLTDEEIESFKRGPKSNTKYMKGYAARSEEHTSELQSH